MLKKRIGVYFICFALVFSYLLSGALMKKEESHAIVGDWIIGKVLDSTLNVVNGLYLEVISQAADQSDNEATKQIMQLLTDADNLILAGSLDKSSEKILKELDEIKTQLTNMEKSIESEMQKIYQYGAKTDAQKIHQEMSRYPEGYHGIQVDYQEYLEAGNAYAQAILDESSGKISKKGVDNAKAALDKSQRKLEDSFNRIGRDSDAFMASTLTSLESLAEDCCMYYPSDYPNPTQSQLGRAIVSASGTYLGHVWTCLESGQPFDHQKYAGMTAAVNYSADCFTTILSGVRIYYDYYTAKHEDDPQKQSSLQALGEHYETAANRVINALNDLGQQCRGSNIDKAYDYKNKMDLTTDITALMRPYDINTKKELNYKKEDNHEASFKLAGWMSVSSHKLKYKASAVESKQEMDFYRVAVAGTPYLIPKSAKIGSSGFVENIYDNYSQGGNNANFVYGQDYFNFKGGTKDQTYLMPRSFQEAIGITNTNAYSNDFSYYLKSKGGLSDIPDDAAYVVTQLDRGYMLPKGFSNTQMGYWCDAKINKATKSGNDEVDLVDVYNYRKKLLVIMNSNKKETSSISIKLSDKERGNLSVTDAKGKSIDGKVEAGTLLTLNVKVNKGYELRSLQFISKNGTKQVIATEDTIDMGQQKKDGSYTFTYPMPYDDCTFQADFQNAKMGKGTENDPYLISTESQLKDYMEKSRDKNSKYNAASYRLTKDISANHLGGCEFGYGGDFKGTFDGGGYAIIGSTSSRGMFLTIGKSGIVKNLTLKRNNSSFDTLLADTNYGLITNCGLENPLETPINNDVHLLPVAVGLLVESNKKGGVIRNCYNSISATTEKDCLMAAIAVHNDGKIQNCYNSGDLSSSKNYCYASCAYMGSKDPESMFNFYNVGKVKGGVVGYGSDIYCLVGSTAMGTDNTALTEGQMKSDQFLDQLNSNALKYEGLNQWVFKEGQNDGYPVFGTIPEWYEISTDIKGDGTLKLTGETGSEAKKAPATAKIKAKAVPGSGKIVDNIKLYDEKGKTLKKFDLKPEKDGSAEVSFDMPDQKVTVHAKFVKEQKQAAVESGVAEENSGQAAQTAFGPAKLVDQASGITVTGDQINAKAILKVTAYDETDPAHVEIQNAASDDVLSAYDISLALVDDKGKEIKSEEEKFKGNVDVAFPIEGEDKEKELKVLHGTEDGLKFADGGMKKDGLYHVEVSHLSPFAVVDYIEDQQANLSAGETIETDDRESSIWIWILLCMAGAAIAGIVLFIRKKSKSAGK